MAFVFGLVQIFTAMILFGRIKISERGWLRAPLVRTGRRRVDCAGGRALLYAPGFQGYSGRVLVHSILGCFFFGAFVSKMLILTRDDSPGWALPALGGTVFSGLTALWMTAALWFFSTNGLTRELNLEENMNPAFTDRAGELSRRRLIRNTGLSALAIGALSACSNYGAQPAAPATSAGSLAPDPAPQVRRGSAIAKADIPVGGGKIFADLQAVVTQPASGEFKAFTSVCTHQGCTVAEVVQTINCNCHGSKFSITDGSVVNGPPPRHSLPRT